MEKQYYIKVYKKEQVGEVPYISFIGKNRLKVVYPFEFPAEVTPQADPCRRFRSPNEAKAVLKKYGFINEAGNETPHAQEWQIERFEVVEACGGAQQYTVIWREADKNDWKRLNTKREVADLLVELSRNPDISAESVLVFTPAAERLALERDPFLWEYNRPIVAKKV